MSKLGRKRGSFCKRGHDLKITRKSHPNGDTYCSKCKSIRHDDFRKNPKNKEKINLYTRKYIIKKMYGIDFNEYNNLLLIQNNKCAICKSYNRCSKSFSIDHDHKTGKVRGLLCSKCNTAIGLLDESEESMINAINYLKNARK